MSHPDLPYSSAFAWPETAEVLERLLAKGALTPAAHGRWYEGHDAQGKLSVALRPPLLLLRQETLPEAAQLLQDTGLGLGSYALLLLQAGATAVARFEEGELGDHKSFKRYVVRGKGRAQPSHLKTRGKSRQGSRLRLRNAERLLVEVSERLGSWFEDDLPPERMYVSCPVRLFADLCRVDPAPPIEADDPRRIRIPLDVKVPTHAELLRVHRSLGRGRVWQRVPWDDAGPGESAGPDASEEGASP